MRETGRRFLVGVPAEIPLPERRHLEAAGIRWRGAYEVLQAGWSDDMDARPWVTRNVLVVAADDHAAAKQHVAITFGRPDAVGELIAEENRPAQ